MVLGRFLCFTLLIASLGFTNNLQVAAQDAAVC